ncbi:MAG: hypothetical protein FD163_402 [Hyphomonadaceae bacterium]|nr:MAG: hypothetical protein FD128_17 [Hyphomonadaceae bacterium]KAF0187127.1 MAG: hypothetical protein FD163_402 [Hyphomonadaceae bacterium]
MADLVPQNHSSSLLCALGFSQVLALKRDREAASGLDKNLGREVIITEWA